MCGLVIQVMLSTYEQIDNSGSISLLNSWKIVFWAHGCTVGFLWVCRSTVRCIESLSLLYQWSRRVLAWRKTNMKEGNRRKKIENGIK